MHFDQIAERVTRAVGKPWFFWLMIGAIVAWLPTLVLTSTGTSDLVIDAIANPISLVLIVLLQNSQYRSDVAQDKRADDVEKAFAVLFRHLARHDPHAECRDALEREARHLVEKAEAEGRLASAGVS